MNANSNGTPNAVGVVREFSDQYGGILAVAVVVYLFAVYPFVESAGYTWVGLAVVVPVMAVVAWSLARDIQRIAQL